MEDRIFIGKEFLKEFKPFYTFEDVLEENKDVLLRLKLSDSKDLEQITKYKNEKETNHTGSRFCT